MRGPLPWKRGHLYVEVPLMGSMKESHTHTHTHAPAEVCSTRGLSDLQTSRNVGERWSSCSSRSSWCVMVPQSLSPSRMEDESIPAAAFTSTLRQTRTIVMFVLVKTFLDWCRLGFEEADYPGLWAEICAIRI